MDYHITSYTHKKVADLNKDLRENISIQPSQKSYYKIDIFNSGSYLFSIGDKRYADYPTYIKLAGKAHADKRRQLFLKRHGKYPKYSRGWFSSYLLW